MRPSTDSPYIWYMNAQSKTYLPPEEYLVRERAAEYKSEYYQGEVFAMSGGTLNHGRIKVNLLRLIADGLGAGGCEIFDSDVRIHIPENSLYTYPDLSVVCGKPEVLDNQNDTLLNP